MIRLASIAASLSLLAAVPVSAAPLSLETSTTGPATMGLAIERAGEAVGVPPDVLDAATGADINHTGLAVLPVLEMEAVSGTGPATDFACGFMSGAGLVLAISGVAAPLGIALALGSAACSFFP